MVAVGALTADPMLIASVIASIIMTSPMLGVATSAITLQLEAQGVPSQAAQIAAEIIVTQGTLVVSMSPVPNNVLAKNQFLLDQQAAIFSDVQLQAAAQQAALQVNEKGEAAVNQAMQQMMELTEQLQEMSASV